MCEKRLVHHDINERLCWKYVEDEDVDICLSQSQIWEEKIMRQVKDWMKATMHVEAATIDMKAESSEQMMQVQSHLVCTVDKAYDSDDINDEKVLSENYDKINVLTALTENNCRCERNLKVLNKNKDIV